MRSWQGETSVQGVRSKESKLRRDMRGVQNAEWNESTRGPRSPWTRVNNSFRLDQRRFRACMMNMIRLCQVKSELQNQTDIYHH